MEEFPSGCSGRPRPCSSTWDIGYVVRLGRALPHELRGRFIGWLRSFSPVIGFQRDGEFSAILLKGEDPNFKSYALTSAAAEPIFDVQLPRPSPGTQFAREIIRKELQGKSLKRRLSVIENWFEGRAARARMHPSLIISRTAAVCDLSMYSHQQLMELYSDATDRLVQGRDMRSESAIERREAIFQEWAVRHRRSIVDEYFDWPSTEAPLGGGTLGQISSPTDGMLNAFGYHVGETNGRPEAVRRILLDDVFACHLPPINSLAYMREWCGPKSAGRLKKLADTLAALCRSEKRRGLTTAPAQRETDLEYICRKYYIGVFGFAWLEPIDATENDLC